MTATSSDLPGTPSGTTPPTPSGSAGGTPSGTAGSTPSGSAGDTPSDTPSESVTGTATPGAVPTDRYGRPAGPGRRRLARAGVAALAAAGVGVVLWLGLGAASTQVSWEEVGYSLDGGTGIALTFDVTKDPDATAVCRVQALSESHAEVGVQTVTVGPAGTSTQRVTTSIATAEQAVTAIVHSCALA